MQQHQEYKISGVSVCFPCKPYPSQFSMMDKIIKGIDRRQNCLIESPTGSGKSLALLCSTLSWLSAEKAKRALDEAEEAEKSECMCGLGQDCQAPPSVISGAKSVTDKLVNGGCKELAEFDFSDDVDDFKLPSKGQKKHISISYEDEGERAGGDVDVDGCCRDKQGLDVSQSCACSCGQGLAEKKQKTRIPKIYFGTRTHRQVAQIVRELRKTGYQDVRMTILGSRDHTCIHGHVSHMSNKNEGCKELLKGPGCHLKDSTIRLTSHNALKGMGLSVAWDLEELVTLCKKKRACPYFLSKGLKDEADLIICPYNYLVDPMVREAMQINLKGHIVILDEAHNIEDSAREAASQSVTQDSIVKAIKDIEILTEANVCLADHSKLGTMLKCLNSFIEDQKDKLEQKEFDRSYRIWSGFHIVAQLESMGLGPKYVPEFKKALNAVRSDAEKQKEELRVSNPEQVVMEMKPSTQTVLEQMFQVLDYLYRSDLKYVDDYRASIVQSNSFIPSFRDGQWLNSRSANGGRINQQVEVYTLNFWCMNPAVAFSDFSETRSIILTSGTLSPLASFQSELGLEFKIQLETNHVIDDSQVWVGTLGQGPSGQNLQAVFRNLETFAFQDELGSLVLKVCQTIPHGVLCFLPSYSVLDKLNNRWENTGLMRKLEQHKTVIREPKGSDKVDFEEQLKLFYETVEAQADDGGITGGAVFFAVCRGKVSEGLDFADNFARAVITVGVPYPNFKDVQVELKRKYNDQYRYSRGLLTGNEWYEIQAFRALNQALGRCIRHRRDWGALIIVDDRFVKTSDKYCRGLSKWVRNKVQTFQNFSAAMESLSMFTVRQQALMDNGQSHVSPLTDVSTNIRQTPVSVKQPSAESNNSSSCGQPVKTPTSTGCGELRKPAQNFPIFSLTGSNRVKNSSSRPQGSKSSVRLYPVVSNTPVKIGQGTSSSGQHQRGKSIESSPCLTVFDRGVKNSTLSSVLVETAATTGSCSSSRVEVDEMLVSDDGEQAQDGAENFNILPDGTDRNRSTTFSGQPSVGQVTLSDKVVKGHISSMLNSHVSGISTMKTLSPGTCKSAVITMTTSPKLYKGPIVAMTTSPKAHKSSPSASMQKTDEEAGIFLSSPVTTEQIEKPEDEADIFATPTNKISGQSVTTHHTSHTTHHTSHTTYHTSFVSKAENVRIFQDNKTMTKPTTHTTQLRGFVSKPENVQISEENKSVTDPRGFVTKAENVQTLQDNETMTKPTAHSRQPIAETLTRPTAVTKQPMDKPITKSTPQNTQPKNLTSEAASFQIHQNSHTLETPPLPPITQTPSLNNLPPTPTNTMTPDIISGSIPSKTLTNNNKKFLFKRSSSETGSFSKRFPELLTPVLTGSEVLENISHSNLSNVTSAQELVMKTSANDHANEGFAPNMIVTRCAQKLAVVLTDDDADEGTGHVENEMLHVRRKKRKRLSKPGLKKRKRAEEEDESCEVRSNKFKFTCSVCGYELLRNVSGLDFIEQRAAPKFVMETENRPQTGAIFFPSGLDCLSLQDLAAQTTSEGLSSRYVEHEDICVQFLSCNQCLKDSAVAPLSVGAQVKLAAGSGARFRRGQVWLFSNAVVQSQEL